MPLIPQSNSPRLKILVAFYFLVALSVLAIVGTVVLNHWIAASYSEAVTLNRSWAARLARLDKLSDEVAEMDAPGNDIFVSGNSAQELQRLRSAYQKVLALHSELSTELRREVSAPFGEEFDQHLQSMLGFLESLQREGEQVMALHSRGSIKEATAHMAAMDTH